MTENDRQNENGAVETAPDAADIEKYLEQRAQMEAMIKDKFTRVLTVVFTDLKGSTTIAETEGDLVSRMLIKEHNDIVFPAIKENHGVFIKSIGDGTLSYFETAIDALRAGVRIQRGMDALNMSGKFKIPVLMRIGMHTGKCIVEKNDIFGDTVNTASRFESNANPGEIFISEDTYNALSDKSEIYCRFAKQVSLKGKKEPYNAYKAFWNPTEIEKDKQNPTAAPAGETRSSGGGKRLMMWAAAAFALVVLLTIAAKFLGGTRTLEDRRAIEHSIAR
ncbi:MAG: adenylate/guanylate cyclase domain-containing protein [Ignavibacteria bacterium]